jgi:hypothetical protein
MLRPTHFERTFATLIAVGCLLLAPRLTAGEVLVRSLEELGSWLGKDSVEVRMAPGVYRLDKATSHEFLKFSGRNSRFEVRNVKIEVDTALLGRFKQGIDMLMISGDHVTVSGLTLHTVGSGYAPGGCRAISIMGDNVTISNISLRLEGSYPYGYGSFFGIGQGAAINPRKLNGIRVGGLRTSVVDCRVIMRSFGHGIFVRGGQDALIKGCYVEGALRKTDDILSEKSGPAFERGFMQYTGEPIRPGEVTSLSEDGIRAYPDDPFNKNRRTQNVRVEDCRVVRMRKGVALSEAGGTNVVQGCDAIEIERVAFHIGSNTRVRNCRADALYAQRGVVELYPDTRNSDVDVEVLDSRKHYGTYVLARISGDGHEVSLKESVPGAAPKSLRIEMGLRDEKPVRVRNTHLYNFTPAPVTMHQASMGCLVESVGLVENRGKDNRVLQLPPKHPSVGEAFKPSDIDVNAPVYHTDFNDPGVLKDWRLEGGKSMSIRNGKLVLESAPGARTASDNTGHLVCWLEREVPPDFLLEFSFRPANRQQGLAIVFFSARGLNGESVFDPALKKRDGTFIQYLRSDINNYHVSYWSGERGTSHLRKSYGAHVTAIGDDLIWQAPADAFQTVRIYKRGGMIRVTVDGVVAVAYDDDGKLFGPVWNHSGWIGLRQMSHTLRAEYDHLTVCPLKPRHADKH